MSGPGAGDGPGAPRLQTARLRLEPVAAADGDRLHRLFVQPGVRRFLFDDEVLARERTAEIAGTSVTLAACHGYGLWLALDRTEVVVGFGGFWYFRDPPELELVFGVADDHVGRGYGREIAGALVDHGRTALGMARIRASTNVEHQASRRLLEALGFALVGERVAGGIATAFYERRDP